MSRSLVTRLLCLGLATTTLVACDDIDDDGAAEPTPMAEPEAQPEPEPEAQPEPAVDEAALRRCEEVDFGSSGWNGPAVVDGVLTLEPEITYQMSTTVLYLKPTDDAFQLFNAKLGPIFAEMGSMDGLLAWHVGGSAACGSQRTITVWRDAAAMYGFVGHPAHVDAMTINAEVSQLSITDVWESAGADVPTDWADYRARLIEAEAY